MRRSCHACSLLAIELARLRHLLLHSHARHHLSLILLMLVVLTLVLSRIAILLLRVVLLAIGHSCHAILVLEPLWINTHVVASLTTALVVVELAHQKTQRSNQTKNICVVGLVDVLSLTVKDSTIPGLLELLLSRFLRLAV